MAKLKLTANPTFKAMVGIPVPGGEPVQVEFTFKHRDRKGLDAFLADLAKEDGTSMDTTVKVLMSCVDGWELDEEFNEANLEVLLTNYHRAGHVISQTYVEELLQAKRKN